MPNALKEFLDLHLLALSGSVLTPGSILIGATVVFVAIAIASVGGRSLRRVLSKRGIPLGTQFAMSKMFNYAVVALGLMVAFNSMGLKLDALIATSAIVAVGIGFGLQTIAQNFISGLILLIEQPVRKGDFIRVGDTLGVVDDIGLRATQIITRDEVTIIVPNSHLVTEPVINHSRPTTNLRARITVGVAYGTDTQLVRDVLIATALASSEVLREPKPDIRFEGFGESSLNFALLVWIEDPRMDLLISSNLRFAIDAAFRKAGIVIPFPQREIHVHAARGDARVARVPNPGAPPTIDRS